MTQSKAAPTIERKTLTFGDAVIEVKAAATHSDVVVGAADVRADEGIVVAITSVTGVLDSVGDIIEPGAYTKTLATRRAKVCWHHSWEKPIGRVLSNVELMPGDKRLPTHQANGEEWPKAAGALLTTMQFNLKSTAGREAFEAVRFYSETAECEWSIGYNALPKNCKMDGPVRRIKALDLYEVSFVLFGANAQTGTLSLKSALSAMHTAVKSGKPEAAAEMLFEEIAEDDEAALHTAAQDHIDWTEVETAAAAAGEAPPVDTTVALPAATGPGSKALLAALAKADVPGVDAGPAASLAGWYTRGKGALKIKWGTPGDLTRCHRIAAKHMTPDQAWGYCNLRHRDALGTYNSSKAAGYDPTIEVDGTGVEAKSFPTLSGTYEERMENIRAAVTARVRASVDWPVIDDDDATRSAPFSDRWHVSIEGTYDDVCVATIHDWSKDEDVRESFEVPYYFDEDDGIVVGEPLAVVLRAVVEDADTTDDIPIGDLTPIVDLTNLVYIGAKRLLAGEEKAGRVLSGSNTARLVASVEALLAVLSAAGVHITNPDDDNPPVEPEPETDSTAPSARAKPEGKGVSIDLRADLASLAMPE